MNFLPNSTLLRLDETAGTGQDANVVFAGAENGVDTMSNGGPRQIVGVMEFSAAAGASRVDLHLQTRAGTTGDWTTVGSLTGLTPKANEYVAIEGDTNSVELKRYVRLSYQRKGANSTVHGAFFILCGMRVKGTVVRGSVSGGGVVSQTSS